MKLIEQHSIHDLSSLLQNVAVIQQSDQEWYFTFQAHTFGKKTLETYTLKTQIARAYGYSLCYSFNDGGKFIEKLEKLLIDIEGPVLIYLKLNSDSSPKPRPNMPPYKLKERLVNIIKR